jgi:hypothetical protein
MRKNGLNVLAPLFFVLCAATAHAQTLNAVTALAQAQASGCNGKNGYVLLWASSMMWAPKGSNANVVNNPIGVLQGAAQNCMERGYVPSGGVTYVGTDPAYYYQPMFLSAAQGNPPSNVLAPAPVPSPSSPVTH